jgi:hypothetical protein
MTDQKTHSAYMRVPLERKVRQPIVLATVHFAITTARVRVIETVVTVNRRLWRVEDILTGHQDVVGEEFLTEIAVA